MKYECIRRSFGANQWIASFLRKQAICSLTQQHADATARPQLEEGNQILSTETETGSEAGGECMSDVNGSALIADGIDSIIVGCKACRRIGAKCVTELSDILTAG